MLLTHYENDGPVVSFHWKFTNGRVKIDLFGMGLGGKSINSFVVSAVIVLWRLFFFSLLIVVFMIFLLL